MAKFNLVFKRVAKQGTTTYKFNTEQEAIEFLGRYPFADRLLDKFWW